MTPGEQVMTMSLGLVEEFGYRRLAVSRDNLNWDTDETDGRATVRHMLSYGIISHNEYLLNPTVSYRALPQTHADLVRVQPVSEDFLTVLGPIYTFR
jgi:hypothetical protein